VKGLYILNSEVEKSIKDMRIRRLQEVMMYHGMYSDFWEKIASD
jgi:hypothetical protein